MNQLRRLMVFTVLFMAAGFISGFSTKEVLAAEKYYNIGMNDSVHIKGEDPAPSKYAYVRFSPKKDGAITFSYKYADYTFAEDVELKLMKESNGQLKDIPTYKNYPDYMRNCDSFVDKILYGDDITATYGVKKGVKYALRIKRGDTYILHSSFKSVSDNGGKKKGSAKTIKKGKAQYGMIPMTGKKQSRWYKFKVPRTKKVTVDFKGWANRKLYYQIIVGGKKAVDRHISYNNWDNDPGTTGGVDVNNKAKKMTATLKKGSVVYLRVYTIWKGCSGYYYWKWN